MASSRRNETRGRKLANQRKEQRGAARVQQLASNSARTRNHGAIPRARRRGRASVGYRRHWCVALLRAPSTRRFSPTPSQCRPQARVLICTLPSLSRPPPLFFFLSVRHCCADADQGGHGAERLDGGDVQRLPRCRRVGRRVHVPRREHGAPVVGQQPFLLHPQHGVLGEPVRGGKLRQLPEQPRKPGHLPVINALFLPLLHGVPVPVVQPQQGTIWGAGGRGERRGGGGGS